MKCGAGTPPPPPRPQKTYKAGGTPWLEEGDIDDPAPVCLILTLALISSYTKHPLSTYLAVDSGLGLGGTYLKKPQTLPLKGENQKRKPTQILSQGHNHDDRRETRAASVR